MLKRVDRVQIAVTNGAEAARLVADNFGAQLIGRDQLKTLAARRTTLQAGASLIELLEPSGPGPVADHLSRWKEGLFAAGFSCASLEQSARLLDQSGVQYREEAGQLFIDSSQTYGMHTVLSAFEERERVGLIRWVYEVTNVVADWRKTAERYTKIFGLDTSRFVPITSQEFGYTGTLTMFEPPARLDRIEITQIVEPDKAMGRFHSRRGDSLYMFYVETDDVNAIADRLKRRGARFAGQTDIPGATGLFIHPTAMCGVLVGVSRTEHAWLWSGNPERAKRADLR